MTANSAVCSPPVTPAGHGTAASRTAGAFLQKPASALYCCWQCLVRWQLGQRQEGPVYLMDNALFTRCEDCPYSIRLQDSDQDTCKACCRYWTIAYSAVAIPSSGLSAPVRARASAMHTVFAIFSGSGSHTCARKPLRPFIPVVINSIFLPCLLPRIRMAQGPVYCHIACRQA